VVDARRRAVALLGPDEPLGGEGQVLGPGRALERAAGDGWTVVSVKDDWTTVF